MLTEAVGGGSADDLPPGGKRRKLHLETDPRKGQPEGQPAADRARCRLFVRFPDTQLRNISQAAALFPTASSIQLPRAVECEFSSEVEAAAVVARLRQSEVTAGRLTSADLARPERPPPADPAARRTVLRDMTRLHVRGIQRTVTVSELRQLFAGCQDVAVPGNNARGNNGYAFVQFPDRQSAAAIAAQQLTLHDKQLTVSYAVERNMQMAADPRYELVEVDGDPGGNRPKQSLPAPPAGGSSKKSAQKRQGNKRKPSKQSKDTYQNRSTVVSS